MSDSEQISEIFDEVEGHDDQTLKEPLEHLHHSLRESFVPLPPFGTTLNQQQLCAVFGGDLRALSEMVRLASHLNVFETEL